MAKRALGVASVVNERSQWQRFIMDVRELRGSVGRHREFDENEALDAAIDVFWAKGYEGASFDDLSKATKVARPGLYAAFGNKESLFLKALDRYEAQYTSFIQEALSLPASLEVVKRILQGTVELNTGHAEHLGCLGVNGAVACSSDAETIRVELVRRRSSAEAALARRLKRAQKEGELSSAAKAETLAKLVMTLTQGISVQAKAGAGRAVMMDMVDQFLQAWPSKLPKAAGRRSSATSLRPKTTKAAAKS